jgi:hypothetical protein
VTPTYRMPDPATQWRAATLAEITDALRAARCTAQLAERETRDCLLRQLIGTVIVQIDRATRDLARLLPSQLR